MDRHDLQPVGRAQVRGAEEVLEVLLEARAVGEVAGLVDGVEAVEEGLGVLEVRRRVEARGAAEREPRALHALAKRSAQPLRQRAGEDGRDALEARPRVGVERRKPRGVGDELGHGALVAAGERQQVRKCQAAPRGPQHREPRRAVGRVGQGARERDEVADALPLAQRRDVHGAQAQPRPAQGRHDAVEVRAVPHEDRHGAAGPLRAGRGHEVDDAARFVIARAIAILVHEQVPAHRLARQRVVECRRHREAHRALRLVVARRQDAAEGAVHPVDDAPLRAEIGLQPQPVEAHVGEPLAPRAQEQAHVGLAEPVDGLHRVAHREDGAPVPGRPARGERGEQVPLASRRVLELVDEHVRQALVEGQQEVRGRGFGAERLHRAGRDLRMVDLAAFREDHEQLRRRDGQHRHHRVERRPLPFVEPRGRQD